MDNESGKNCDPGNGETSIDESRKNHHVGDGEKGVGRLPPPPPPPPAEDDEMLSITTNESCRKPTPSPGAASRKSAAPAHVKKASLKSAAVKNVHDHAQTKAASLDHETRDQEWLMHIEDLHKEGYAEKESNGTVFVEATVRKETWETKMGVKFGIVISDISAHSPFRGTGLQVGNEVVSINNTPCQEFSPEDCAEIIRQVEGDLKIVTKEPSNVMVGTKGHAIASPQGKLQSEKQAHQYNGTVAVIPTDVGAEETESEAKIAPPSTTGKNEQQASNSNLSSEQMAWEVGMQPLTRGTHINANEALSPGAYSVRGESLDRRSRRHMCISELNPSDLGLSVNRRSSGTITHLDPSARLNERQNTEEVLAVVLDEDELQQRVRQDILENTIRAEVVASDLHRKRSKTIFFTLCLFIALVVIGITVGFSVGFTRNDDESSISTDSPTQSPTAVPRPTLEVVLENDVLRCGVPGNIGFGLLNEETGEREGIDIDLCRAVAAAMLGDPEKIDTQVLDTTDRFVALADRSIDLLVRQTTHTMERDVFEESAAAGFSFTVPYLYDGLRFGGIPPFGECADNLDSFFGDCRKLKICVIDGTTLLTDLRPVLPGSVLVPVPTENDLGEGLINGTCNAIAGESTDVSEVVVRQLGYNGEYEIGKNLFSKEPLAAVTREDDPQWSDTVNLIVQALIAAEEQGVTQSTASTFSTTTDFGAEFENMFVNAIAAVGNYGEIYDRHLEAIVPRGGLNVINYNGSSGLLYSHPYGTMSNPGPGPFPGGTLDRILKRGYLLCGITVSAGFGEVDPGSENWSGLDADYCRALSASVFAGVIDSVRFVDLTGVEFPIMALENGEVDILTRAAVDLSADAPGEGLSFSMPYFYNFSNSGSSLFGEAYALATRRDDRQFADFVYWVVSSTFFAEEEAITQSTSGKMPLTLLFGPTLERMLRDAILAVGNYGDMYGRNLEALLPRSDANSANTIPFGPQFRPFL